MLFLKEIYVSGFGYMFPNTPRLDVFPPSLPTRAGLSSLPFPTSVCLEEK